MRLTPLISFIALVVASSANAAPCQEPKLEAVSSDHPECRFYKGTRHFREKEYSVALKEWLAVVDTEDMPKELEYLRLNAQNNLGYLYYMGLGVQQNSAFAIQKYWLPAEKAGHEEAAYHLCHAYADENRKLALGYCREALRRYNKLGEADEDNGEVVAQLRLYIARLEAM
jgi:TPR repeat protein